MIALHSLTGMLAMRLTLLLFITLIALSSCATTSSAPASAPALSDAQRCARFGGYWTPWGVCQGGY
jgi:hypothetical protein